MSDPDRDRRIAEHAARVAVPAAAEREPEDLKKGDVVQLVSGGPLMSVNKKTVKFVTCQWFNRRGVLDTAKFPIEMVRLVTP